MSLRHHLLPILQALAIFAAVVALAASFWRHPEELAGGFALASGLLFVLWHRLDDVVYYCVSAVVGPLGELVAIHAGAWSYADHGLGFPVWLPLAWGVCGVTLRRLSAATVGWARS
jgi:uncharacterized membrane protein YoaT (DUF817 family)